MGKQLFYWHFSCMFDIVIVSVSTVILCILSFAHKKIVLLPIVNKLQFVTGLIILCHFTQHTTPSLCCL